MNKKIYITNLKELNQEVSNKSIHQKTRTQHPAKVETGVFINKF